MAKDFIAIDTEKRIYEFSEFGLNSLKSLHKNQKLTGWQYGLKSEKSALLAKIITAKDAQNAIEENAILKEKLAKFENGAKSTNKSDKTEKA
jgi:hypothetical protein